MSLNPTLEDVVKVALETHARRLRVALPGRVERYDAARGTVDVQPLLRDVFEDADGETQVEALPVLPDVPVLFPGSAGFRLTFPIAPGDGVLLVFCDASLEEWKAGGGLVTPQDVRRHHLSDAVALPGLFAPAWPDAHGSEASFGSATGVRVFFDAATVSFGEANATDALALASKTRSELEALRTSLQSLVDAFNLHVHTSAAAGSPTSTPMTAPAVPLSVDDAPVVGEVASTLVKAKE